MSNPNVIGTPDWQRGVASSQKLLASIPAGTDSVTVTVPPNVEILWISIDATSNVGTYDPVVTGASGLTYPVYQLPQYSRDASTNFAVMVSSVIDESVTITLYTTPTVKWRVVADSSGRFIVDTTIGSTIGETGGSTPRSVLQIGGDNNNTVIAFRLTQSGEVVDVHPKSTSGQVAVGTAWTDLWSASVAATYFVFGVDLVNTTASAIRVYLGVSGTGDISSVIVPANGSVSVDMNGFEIPEAALQALALATGVDAYCRYYQTTP